MLRNGCYSNELNKLSGVGENLQQLNKKEQRILIAVLISKDDHLTNLMFEMEILAGLKELFKDILATDQDIGEQLFQNKFKIKLESVRSHLLSSYENFLNYKETKLEDATFVKINAGKKQELLATQKEIIDAILNRVIQDICSKYPGVNLTSLYDYVENIYKEKDSIYEEYFKRKIEINTLLNDREEELKQLFQEVQQIRNQLKAAFSNSLTAVCQHGNHQQLMQLINAQYFFNKSSYINQLNEDGESPLHIACLEKQFLIAKALLKYGADFKKRNREGYLPIHYTARIGALEIVKLLLLMDKSIVNALGNYDRTPLDEAVYHGQLEVVKYLLSQGAKVNMITSAEGLNRTPLQNAAMRGHLDIVAILLKAGANPNVLNPLDEPPVVEASLAGHVAVVKCFINHNVMVKEELCLQTLEKAHSRGQYDLVEVWKMYLLQLQKQRLNSPREAEVKAIVEKNTLAMNLAIEKETARIKQEYANKQSELIAEANHRTNQQAATYIEELDKKFPRNPQEDSKMGMEKNDKVERIGQKDDIQSERYKVGQLLGSFGILSGVNIGELNNVNQSSEQSMEMKELHQQNS